jgi:ferritin-like metal-binding protein YciE
MKIRSARDLFVLELQDLYDAEQQIIQATPQLIEMTYNAELRRAFTEHYHETQGQIKKLEQIFREYSVEPLGKQCIGMEGIIEEMLEALQENDRSALLDPILIGNAQRIEHYEIAGYGTAATFAKMLGYENAMTALLDILEQEKDTDGRLSMLAKTLVNKEAFMTPEKLMM